MAVPFGACRPAALPGPWTDINGGYPGNGRVIQLH